MTELEWLKQESGMTDEEMSAIEAVAGAGKFKSFLVKAVAANQQASSDKSAAEQARLDLESRYNNEFIPEMRKVTQDSLRAQAEAAAAKAQLEAARQYGIVPDQIGEVRAPGSPTQTQQVQQTQTQSGPDFNEWSQRQSRAILTLNDLNAEHFKLFGSPLSNSQALVEKVEREQTLGRKDYTLNKAWEDLNNVPAKRAEMAAAEQSKRDDTIRAEERKKIMEAGGQNPNVRSGQPSRFSTYKPSDANSTKPWQTPSGMRKSANQPWRDAAASKIRAVS